MRIRKSRKIFFLLTIGIGLFSGLLSLCLYIWSPPFLREIDLRYGDLRFRTRGGVKPNSQVVIVAIDEKSVNELGRWPWSRHRLAELIDRLESYGPKVVVFDIIFSERESEDADRALAAALEKYRNVILAYFFRDDATEEPPSASLKQIERSNIKLIKSLGGPESNLFKEFRSADLNITEIGSPALGFGFFNVDSDEDGIVRRARLLIEYKDEIYPSLNLESMRHFLGGEILLSLAPYGVDGLYLKQIQVPTDEGGQFLVDYYGPSGTFPTYSVVDILSGKVPHEALKGKLVFIGATETGISDVKPTPFDSDLPGVEIHATVAGNILDGRFLIRDNLTEGLDIVLLLVLPLLLVYLLMRIQKTFSGLLIFLAFVLLHAVGNYLLFARLNLLLSFVYPGLSLVFAYTLFEGYRNIVVEKRNRYLRTAFSSYVSPDVVSDILQNPDKLKLGGEKRKITVLFSDIRGFTSLSEKIPPETLVALLNEYLSPMTQVVMRERGTLDKYIGDAVMAIFGAPLNIPDHSKRACQAALYMLERLERLNLEWESRGWPHISIGIGVNTGEAIVGNMGSNVRFEYTAIGDTVNLASRLEGLNKVYGTEVIVSKLTLENLDPSEFLLRELDLVRVKGKLEPISVSELIGFYPGDLKKATLARLFSEALCLYRERRFYKAREKFSDVLDAFPEDRPSAIYFERCSDYIVQPPPSNWDGIYIAQEK